MKSCTVIGFLIYFLAGLFCSPVKAFPAIEEPAANKYRTISALACDSLIKVHEKNPDFVILDVRTPDAWKSDHLTGSVCRNYYDADFNTQLNVLPKNKIFLLHCQSGGRSAPTLAMMKNLNFAEVYEMRGGINAWKSALLKTTTILAPRLMLVSNDGIKKGTVQYGRADTLKITLTNRANDTLKFTSVTVPAGNEFSSNFDLKKKLTGSEDYTFSVYYKPRQLSKDSVQIGIKSNGGELALRIILKLGTIQEIRTINRNELTIYPNPANRFISFESVSETTVQEVTLINLNGQLVKKVSDYPVKSPLNVADLPEGIYFVRIVSENRIVIKKLLLSR